VTTVLVLVVVGLLIAAVVVIAAIEPGPSTADVALAYEHAWDRLDFATVWALSGQELRDGLDRRAFVRAKRGAYATGAHPADLVATAAVADVAEAGDVAAADGPATANSPAAQAAACDVAGCRSMSNRPGTPPVPETTRENLPRAIS